MAGTVQAALGEMVEVTWVTSQWGMGSGLKKGALLTLATRPSPVENPPWCPLVARAISLGSQVFPRMITKTVFPFKLTITSFLWATGDMVLV